MMEVAELYQLLRNAHGESLKRGKISPWWPGETQDEIIIGAVLTQNTRWGNVEKSLENLRKEGLLDLRKILHAPEEKLRNLIRPSGFQRQKASYLKSVSSFIVPYLGSRPPPREDLLRVKGIGEETADSILLYAFHVPEFVVDAYTKRLSRRLWGLEGSYRQIKEVFESSLPRRWRVFAEYHGLIVEFSKATCRKKPLCSGCPLRDGCRHFTMAHNGL